MFKYKHNIKQIHFNELKRRVVARFNGELINSHQVELLRNDIKTKTDKNLSASTLIRMFVSSSYKNTPYLNTLDILSDYATGKMWNQFCSQESIINESVKNTDNQINLQLLEICFQNEDFKTVLDYMSYLPAEYDEVSPETQIKLSNLFGVSIRNTNQRLALTKELAKTRQGRFLFFETFVDIDNLTGYYGQSLDFYERYGQVVDTKRKLNDYIFLQCMRFWKAWLLQDIKEVKKVGYQLFGKYQPKEIIAANGVMFYPFARWHAYRLIYLNEANMLTQNLVEDAILLLESAIKFFNPNKTVIVLSKLFEALLITNHSKLIYPLYLKYKAIIDLGEVNNDTYLPLLQYVKMALVKEGKNNLANNIFLPKIQQDLLTIRATYARLCNQFSV